MSVEEKKRILSEDYGIAMTYELKEGMKEMCNLSEGIYERGMERGRLLTIVGVIRNILGQGNDVGVLAEMLNESVEFVQKVIAILIEEPVLSDADIVEKYLK